MLFPFKFIGKMFSAKYHYIYFIMNNLAKKNYLSKINYLSKRQHKNSYPGLLDTEICAFNQHGLYSLLMYLFHKYLLSPSNIWNNCLGTSSVGINKSMKKPCLLRTCKWRVKSPPANHFHSLYGKWTFFCLVFQQCFIIWHRLQKIISYL